MKKLPETAFLILKEIDNSEKNTDQIYIDIVQHIHNRKKEGDPFYKTLLDEIASLSFIPEAKARTSPPKHTR